MKRIFVLTWCFLCLLFATASFAENDNHVVFAFEETNYTVYINKTIKKTPILQGEKGKFAYAWYSSDDSIASVNDAGTVKGISGGNTTITCIATNDEKSYSASYEIEVVVPIASIKADVSELELAPIPPSEYDWDTRVSYGYTDLNSYQVNVTISPENASYKELEWKSSDILVARVDETGRIYADKKPGTATITGTAKDGSNKKVSIKVTVPKTYVSTKKYTFTEESESLDFYTIHALISGINTYTTKEKGDSVNIQYVDRQFGLSHYLITPVKEGTTTMKYLRNGKTQATVTFIVKKSAVFDPSVYAKATTDTLLTDSNNGKQYQVTGTVDKIDSIDDGEMLVVIHLYENETKKFVMLQCSSNMSVDVGKEYTFYGILSETRNYRSETGLLYECPYLISVRTN